VNTLPPDDRAFGSEPVLGGVNGFERFDGLDDGLGAELAAALSELGRQVRPREFDSHAILRRTARRRAGRVLAASAAGVAVVVGATAFAVRPGATPPPANAPLASASAADGSDPLTVPGYFRAAPNGGAANGFTQLGATTYAVANDHGTPNNLQVVQTDWTVDGVDQTAQVSWSGDTTQTEAPAKETETVVGVVNGRPAYYNAPNEELTFWTGSQGYATAVIFLDSTNELSQSTTADELLNVAKSLVTAPAVVPMPLRVSGLDSATVIYAGMGSALAGQSEPWTAELNFVIDGREYDITALPGPAVTPSPTGTFTTTGLISADKTVNGLGIDVSTSSGKEGSVSAPTAAQVLAHVTSLGVAPSGWTTSVMVP
jgi:hypothetical protein